MRSSLPVSGAPVFLLETLERPGYRHASELAQTISAGAAPTLPKLANLREGCVPFKQARPPNACATV